MARQSVHQTVNRMLNRDDVASKSIDFNDADIIGIKQKILTSQGEAKSIIDIKPAEFHQSENDPLCSSDVPTTASVSKSENVQIC